MTSIMLESVNFLALLMLGLGFFWKDNRCHLVRAMGWTGLGLYWVTKALPYFEHNDWVNGLGAAMALPIFLFLAFQEFRSYKWEEEYPPLRFVTGAMFIAGMAYVLIDNVPVVSEALIGIVAEQSVWLANIFGYDFGIRYIASDGAPLTGHGTNLIIVLDCTAIQAILVAGSFLFGSRGDPKKRAMIFALFVPVIWITNLVRNVLVMTLVADNGTDYFEIAHSYIGKTLSLIVLIVLILIAFWKVPELYEDINGLFDLPWRNKPKHDYLQFVGRLYDKDKDTEQGTEEEPDTELKED